MKAAVVFFSRSGENFVGGKRQMITIGNTAIVAQKIASQLKLEPIELKALEAYPASYDETVRRAEAEKKLAKRVAYQPFELEYSKLEALFLGYPNWWGSYPQIVATFLADFETKGLDIYPFCTHEGSALGSSLADLKKSCPAATIKTGLPIRGSCAEQSEAAVKNWLTSWR